MNQYETIIAVKKNSDGDLIAFKTSSGKTLDYQQAINEIQNKVITGVNVFTGKDGEQYIRSNADGDPSNNLDALPTF